MSLAILGHSFLDPVSTTSTLRDSSGVYVILTRKNSTENFTLVDVGESATVKTRVDNHDRSNCWNRNKQGELKVSVLYTPSQSERMEIEQAIRAKYRPVCGDR